LLDNKEIFEDDVKPGYIEWPGFFMDNKNLPV